MREVISRFALNGRQTIFSDYGAKEIGNGLVQKIKKDLGLKKLSKEEYTYSHTQ